jgi:hypothetical protein
MATFTIKGRTYESVTIKDSFDRRALQIKNTILSKLRKIGVSEDDADIELEARAMRRTPASVTWYMDGHRLYYSCSSCGKYVENLQLVSQVLDKEITALLNEEVTFREFVEKFTEQQDIEDERKKARETLGLDASEVDMAVINKRYKELATAHHPDKEGGDTEKFKAINTAHKTLKRELQ